MRVPHQQRGVRHRLLLGERAAGPGERVKVVEFHRLELAVRALVDPAVHDGGEGSALGVRGDIEHDLLPLGVADQLAVAAQQQVVVVGLHHDSASVCVWNPLT
jgi:hypothetical protein